MFGGLERQPRTPSRNLDRGTLLCYRPLACRLDARRSGLAPAVPFFGAARWLTGGCDALLQRFHDVRDGRAPSGCGWCDATSPPRTLAAIRASTCPRYLSLNFSGSNLAARASISLTARSQLLAGYERGVGVKLQFFPDLVRVPPHGIPRCSIRLSRLSAKRENTASPPVGNVGDITLTDRDFFC